MNAETRVLVSVIMPVYNADEFLEESIKSILAQSCTEWELIIIDDGSQDNTAEICDRYSGADTRIKVIHQQNGGVSKARNVGIDEAKGKFIVFVDADDILPDDSLEKRIQQVQDYDFFIGGFEAFSGEKVRETNVYDTKIYDNHDILLSIVSTNVLGYQGYIWNKLFRSEIIKKHRIRFDEQIQMNEDRLFCAEYIRFCKQTIVSKSIVYRYRLSENNITSSVYRMKNADYNRFVTEFLAFDRILQLILPENRACYYWCAIEAQYRAAFLKRYISHKEKKLIEELNKRIIEYGHLALQAPLSIIGPKKKMIIIAHMLLKK